MNDRPDDERLRDLLRGADPAASLPPADPSRVARLMEITMSDDPLTETRQDGTRNRSTLTWLVAAAALVVIGGAGAFVLINDEDEAGVPVAQESIEPTDETAPVTTLAASAPDARCGVPTAAMLAQQQVAFEGTVQEVADDVVVLVPSLFYAGKPSELVEVQGPPQELSGLLQAVPFEEGERYLVSASDGRVSLCGLSGPVSQNLQELYVAAFGS
ncbi:hypothetical protein GHK92_01910 [Nocardioides sp. dk4132]|uniref:hypothetical protein n=1 Tax=unclassified Nocardioides TaxID=2615069 RepID=UPI001295E358|nr:MULTISPECIES: hypothetical protein [unclassified Nocardioides]MQW74617.1 hypothetical protein [Nocardioides sp. dk4132]QGA06531.1 hypothetical protein GFH29_03355 [Nocardioides sp. dk884]